ncbi:MAG: type II toxin-antitoxin system RelE/ParE family toxin [Akkermansiaceae bacterium]|nr:type II toxin-antitoxin system RelE/ParE family toxin [Verrucomicrobiales bacterium]
MDFKIIWSPRGIETLQELIEYISRDNPEAAGQMGEAVFQKTLLLGQNPRLGKVFVKLNRDDIRETPVHPYRLIYRVQDSARTITILTVWHGARQEPEIS